MTLDKFISRSEDGIYVDQTMNKKQIRKAVKTALNLYQNNKISEDLLIFITEMAMGLEISVGLDEMLKKKSDYFWYHK